LEEQTIGKCVKGLETPETRKTKGALSKETQANTKTKTRRRRRRQQQQQQALDINKVSGALMNRVFLLCAAASLELMIIQ
jgi:hypothetical protein